MAGPANGRNAGVLDFLWQTGYSRLEQSQHKGQDCMTIDILESQFAAKCTIKKVEKEQNKALFEIELDKRTAILREQVVAVETDAGY